MPVADPPVEPGGPGNGGSAEISDDRADVIMAVYFLETSEQNGEARTKKKADERDDELAAVS
jgi:hypothetical protein